MRWTVALEYLRKAEIAADVVAEHHGTEADRKNVAFNFSEVRQILNRIDAQERAA